MEKTKLPWPQHLLTSTRCQPGQPVHNPDGKKTTLQDPVPYFDFWTVVPLKRSIKSSAVKVFLKSLLMDFWIFLKSVIRPSV